MDWGPGGGRGRLVLLLFGVLGRGGGGWVRRGRRRGRVVGCGAQWGRRGRFGRFELGRGVCGMGQGRGLVGWRLRWMLSRPCWCGDEASVGLGRGRWELWDQARVGYGSDECAWCGGGRGWGPCWRGEGGG
ncbi:hypothetical protein BDZ85DRAFT_270224 [Elsinoe ampelina]|uniref:Uncharacterized protein n=1 Tax=Elsinoe ampelina TaxID=302913 RepID=A0A6A6FYM2_9PEZI|nr:hypothetical protein BDZ85DRAFT_270224 [Elsinoe ampelina]